MRGQPDFDFLFEPRQAFGGRGSTRVLFAESRRMVAEALMLAIEIEPSLDPIGYAIGGWEALELMESLRPDVIVVGPQLAGEDGFPVLQLLTELYPRVRLVVLTETEDADKAAQDRAAAVDYLPLDRSTDELIDAIGVASARPNRLSLVGASAPAEAHDG